MKYWLQIKQHGQRGRFKDLCGISTESHNPCHGKQQTCHFFDRESDRVQPRRGLAPLRANPHIKKGGYI